MIGVLRRTVVIDWRFDNLCGSHLQSQSHLTRFCLSLTHYGRGKFLVIIFECVYLLLVFFVVATVCIITFPWLGPNSKTLVYLAPRHLLIVKVNHFFSPFTAQKKCNGNGYGKRRCNNKDCCSVSIASSRVQTPLKSWLFQASIRNCLNCVHNCDDHSLLE